MYGFSTASLYQNSKVKKTVWHFKEKKLVEITGCEGKIEWDEIE